MAKNLLYKLSKSEKEFEKESELFGIVNHDILNQPVGIYYDDMKILGKKIQEIEESWEYRKLISFDMTELCELRKRYVDIQRLQGEINSKQYKPGDKFP